MLPVNPYVTDGTTFVNPVGLVFTLVMGLLLIVLPRRYALIPVIMLTCYMTMGMRIMVVGLNFTMLRILLLFGWARLILRGEFRSIKLNRIDKALLWWTLSSIVTYFLLWQTYDAFKDKLGLAYNAIGFYFLFRFLVRDLDEVVQVLKITAILLVPLAGSMLMEKATGRNSFALFGGVSPVTIVRREFCVVRAPSHIRFWLERLAPYCSLSSSLSGCAATKPSPCWGSSPQPRSPSLQDPAGPSWRIVPGSWGWACGPSVSICDRCAGESC